MPGRTDSGSFLRLLHSGAQPAAAACHHLPSPDGTNSGAESSVVRIRNSSNQEVGRIPRTEAINNSTRHCLYAAGTAQATPVSGFRGVSIVASDRRPKRIVSVRIQYTLKEQKQIVDENDSTGECTRRYSTPVLTPERAAVRPASITRTRGTLTVWPLCPTAGLVAVTGECHLFGGGP